MVVAQQHQLEESGLLLALDYMAEQPQEFLSNFYLKSKRSVAKAKTEGPAAWVIPNDGKRPALAAQLAGLLQRQGAEVHRLDQELEVKPTPAPRKPPKEIPNGRESRRDRQTGRRKQPRKRRSAKKPEPKIIKDSGGQLHHPHGSAVQPDGRHAARHPVLLDG